MQIYGISMQLEVCLAMHSWLGKHMTGDGLYQHLLNGTELPIGSKDGTTFEHLVQDNRTYLVVKFEQDGRRVEYAVHVPEIPFPELVL